METYKKGDYLAIRTNQPAIGFIERFGHGLSTDNVEPEDYIARVKEVIDSENYFVYIPSVGYRCIIDSSEIVGKVSESELAAEDKKEEHPLFSFLYAPTYVYENEEEVPGNSIAEKCEYLARKAMSALFPQNIIVSINVAESEFMKADLLSSADRYIKEEYFKDKQFFESFKKKRNYFAEMLQHLRFKEYYTVNVGIQDEVEENTTNYQMVVVDTNFEQVVITTDIDERTKFFCSLGPEYDSVNRFYHDLMMEAIMQEPVIKIKL